MLTMKTGVNSDYLHNLKPAVRSPQTVIKECISIEKNSKTTNLLCEGV